MIAFLKLLGMFISDGYFHKSKLIINVNKDRKKEYLICALNGCINYKLYVSKNKNK